MEEVHGDGHARRLTQVKALSCLVAIGSVNEIHAVGDRRALPPVLRGNELATELAIDEHRVDPANQPTIRDAIHLQEWCQHPLPAADAVEHVGSIDACGPGGLITEIEHAVGAAAPPREDERGAEQTHDLRIGSDPPSQTASEKVR